jgi:hypothetical protein
MRSVPLRSGALVLALTSVLCSSCGGAEESPGALGPRYGISVSLPDGWDGELRRGALRAKSNDAEIELFETGRENTSPPPNLREYPALDGALRFDGRDFKAGDGVTVDSKATGHGFARRTFQLSGRLFVVFVETGSRPPRPRTHAEVNELLGSLEVAPGDFHPGLVEPPRFAGQPGWHIGDSGIDDVGPDGEWTTAWASTIPYADEWNALPMQRTLERLPANGIVIWLGLSRTNRFPPEFEAREPPFRLDTFERHEAWEGQVRDIPEHRLWATVHEDTMLDLRVFFGRRDPSEEMRAEAQAMLDGLELPDWGPWELEP